MWELEGCEVYIYVVRWSLECEWPFKNAGRVTPAPPSMEPCWAVLDLTVNEWTPLIKRSHCSSCQAYLVILYLPLAHRGIHNNWISLSLLLVMLEILLLKFDRSFMPQLSVNLSFLNLSHLSVNIMVSDLTSIKNPHLNFKVTCEH